jgi:hypothetical protein
VDAFVELYGNLQRLELLHDRAGKRGIDQHHVDAHFAHQ